MKDGWPSPYTGAINPFVLSEMTQSLPVEVARMTLKGAIWLCASTASWSPTSGRKKIVGGAITESAMFQSEKARALEASILDNLKKTTCKCRR